MRTTRAVRLVAKDRAKVEDIEIPDPGPDEVVVEMAFAGVNPLDTYVLAGRVGDVANVPRILGVEGAGRLDGEPVLVYGHGVGVARDGTWTGVAVVPRAATVPVPPGVDLTVAAVTGVVGTTAVRAVDDHGEVGPTDRVLVLGAGGGVGTPAVSLAKSRGAQVWGQTASESKAAVIGDLGAQPVLARTGAELATAVESIAPTVVLDPLGGEFTAAVVESAPPRTRLVLYGTSAGATATVNLQAVYRKNLTIRGYGGVGEPPERIRAGAEAALRAIADGSLTIVVSDVVPLDEVDSALEALGGRKVAGKLVLKTS
jgi:NADPH2:quinone reductase